MIFRGKLEKVLKEATTYMESKYPKTDNPFAYHFVAFELRNDMLPVDTYFARMKENLDTPDHKAHAHISDHNQIFCTGKLWKAVLR